MTRAPAPLVNRGCVASGAHPPAPANDRNLRVLVACHSHPEISKGGAEIAAFELYRRLAASEGVDAWFLGCSRDQAYERLGTTITQPFGPREYIYSAQAFDWFKFANRDPRFPKAFRDLLRELKPDALHFHHYTSFGVEVFKHIRDLLPDARIVLTLHEYLAICHHLGQMVTTEKFTLCNAAGNVACARCFGDLSPSDFYLRRRYLQRFLAMVDEFVAPSEFLRQRYIDWGLPAERISVIENVTAGQRQIRAVRVQPEERGAHSLRVGYFGQISRLKGVNVLLEAADRLARDEASEIVFDIFGDYRWQPPEFQADFLSRIEKAGNNVRYHGPYDNSSVDRLMQAVDVVLVPSVWWENSPVVIQEALRNRRPIICSDIGGMAEKVVDGRDGWHFPAGSPLALANLLKRLTRHMSALEDASRTLRAPAEGGDTLSAHLRLYRGSFETELDTAQPAQPAQPVKPARPPREVSPLLSR